MKILFLTLAGIDDRSFGGAIRGNDMLAALRSSASVDVLVIRGGSAERVDPAWDAGRVKHAVLSEAGLSPAGIRQRLRVRRWLEDTLESGGYDVIVARYFGLSVYVPLRYWRRLILDADDIFKSSSASMTFWQRVKLRLRNAVARRLLRMAAHVWFVNPIDARQSSLSRASLLENAVAMPVADRRREPPVEGRILMVGFLEHPPNEEGLRWFVANVLPQLSKARSSVELHVIGKHRAGFEAAFPGLPVRIRGFVHDLVPEYDRAALVIAPIRSGGGTQIKVIDALAHGRPLVVSKFAHAGFANELHDGRDLLVADDAADWVHQCARLLSDQSFAATLGAAGFSAVSTRFGTPRMASKISESLRLVVARATS